MTSPVRRTNRIDWFTLVAGLGSLLIAGYVLGDGPSWWPAVDLRWLIAGGAVLVGAILLGSSLRRGPGD